MEHTSKQYEIELEALRSGLLHMGGLVEAQFERALGIIDTNDAELLRTVVREEKNVNDMQLDLDRKGLEIIAKRQPTAIDLRQIMCTLQAVNDLERMGDEVKKIADRAGQLHATERLQKLRTQEILLIGQLAQNMLKATLDAFARVDAISAAHLIGQDEAIDIEFERILRLLVTYMMEDPRTISAGLDVAFLAKAMERVADHCKNINEYVIHIVRGQDPRHTRV